MIREFTVSFDHNDGLPTDRQERELRILRSCEEAHSQVHAAYANNASHEEKNAAWSKLAYYALFGLDHEIDIWIPLSYDPGDIFSVCGSENTDLDNTKYVSKVIHGKDDEESNA